jgi:NADPH2:quinone reductase
VAGLQWSDYRDQRPDMVAAAQQKIFALWQEGRLDPHVSAVLPLSRFREALEALRQGEAKGKIILKTGQERE